MANGLFNLKQVMQAVQQGGWPAQKTPAVEYLVVAGGGGGVRGGGGGGGLLQGIDPVPNGQTLLVTVGAGGAGRIVNGNTIGGSGGNSVFGAITALGGGGGGADVNGTIPGYYGASGGSGGGGAASAAVGITLGGAGVVNQGNAGGSNGAFIGSPYPSGGGGGAGTIGLNATGDSVSGDGGAGIASVISGTVTAYAGGGGGGNYNGTGTVGVGGIGGGGSGSLGSNGGNGAANTGGGGGGSNVSSSGGNGGDGIAIVSYPDVYAAATTVNATASTSGSGSILFNGTSQYLSTSATQVVPATGDFTIEAWIYPTSFSGSPVFCGQGSAGDAGRTLFYISTGGVPTFSNGSSFTFTSTGTVSLNTWTYIAFTRSGNTGTWYINGASAGTGSLSGITIQNTFVTIGGSNPLWTAQYFTGNISNFRISTVARTITSTPTAPFDPSTTNTKMLLSTASGAFLADASTNAYTFTNNGTSTWNQLSPFATGSGYKNRVYTWTTSGSITF
jgi:mucin-19